MIRVVLLLTVLTAAVAHAQAPTEAAPAVPPMPTASADPNMPAEAVPGTIVAPNPSLNLPSRDFLEPYIFDAREGRRNPFRPFVLRGEDGSSVAIGPATPLERFEVEELTLLAVMWDVKTPKAMIMDPLKNIHTITKDDRIGRKKGYVATIREGEIVIVETTEFNGEPVFSTRVIELKK